MKPDEILMQQRRTLAVLKGFNFSSVSETALRIKRSRSLVAHMAADGKIPGAFKIGGNWMIPRKWVFKKQRKQNKLKPDKDPMALKDPSKREKNER